MNKNPPLIVAGVVFALVAFAHLLRLIYGAGVIIAAVEIPMWVSWVGFIVPLILAIWLFTASID